MNNQEHITEGKIFILIQTDTFEQHRARQQGPIRNAPSQSGLRRGLVKLCASMARQSQHSHIIAAFMVFLLRQIKLFSEFPTEGKFGSWLFSTRMGRAVPEEPFAQAEQEQQQAVNLFPAWTRAMEAEELSMSSLQGCTAFSAQLPPSPPAAFSPTMQKVSADFRQMNLMGISWVLQGLDSAAPSPPSCTLTLRLLLT